MGQYREHKTHIGTPHLKNDECVSWNKRKNNQYKYTDGICNVDKCKGVCNVCGWKGLEANHPGHKDGNPRCTGGWEVNYKEHKTHIGTPHQKNDECVSWERRK